MADNGTDTPEFESEDAGQTEDSKAPEKEDEAQQVISEETNNNANKKSAALSKTMKKVGLNKLRNPEQRRASFHGKDEHAKDNKVIDAAMNGDLNKMKKYIEEYGYDVDKQDKYGRTLLIYASLKGKMEIVKYLLNIKQMDPNLVDNKGRAPLHWLATSGNPEIGIIELMCDHGVNLDLQDSEGCTPLMIACQKVTTERMIRCLLQKGANKDITVPLDSDGHEDDDNDEEVSFKGKDAVEIAELTCGPTWRSKVERLMLTKVKDDEGVTTIKRTPDRSPWIDEEEEEEIRRQEQSASELKQANKAMSMKIKNPEKCNCICS